MLRNLGGGRFAAATPPITPLGEQPAAAARGRERVMYFGDLDGDGVAEYVTQQEVWTAGKTSMRKQIEHAKRPVYVYRFHRMRPDFSMEPKPYLELHAEGYAFAGSDAAGGEGDAESGGGLEMNVPAAFQDLEGNGRQDLITMTLDVSLLQALRVLTVKRISIGVDFHIWCQGKDGRFAPVRGLDIGGRFDVDLNNLKVSNLLRFGDFDGDGRTDFIQMGRGRTANIHLERPGCSYSKRPDLTVELREPPLDLSLVQVKDLDGDGRADFLIVQPQRPSSAKPGEAAVTPPVRLDLYLSRGKP